jgi:hypothetical protein
VKNIYNLLAPVTVQKTARGRAPIDPQKLSLTFHPIRATRFVGKIPTEFMEHSGNQTGCLSDFSRSYI